MSQAAPKHKAKAGRGRLRKWAVVFVLLAAIAAVVVWYTGSLGTSYKFRKESTELLGKISAGQAALVYDQASFQFREKLLPDTFADRVARLNATLGRFLRIAGVEATTSVETIGGRAVTVEYDLDFEASSTTAEISYLQEADGVWRLLGFSVRIPPLLEGKAEELEAEYDRIKAPDEVVTLLSELMARIGKGEGAEVRAEASPPFRESVSEEAFAALLASQKAELGSFLRVVAILSSGQNSAMTRATVDALLEYEKHRTPGSFEFIMVDGHWRLLQLKIEIPEPLLPARAH